MNLNILLWKAAVLLSQASERAGAGFPNQAKARLVTLRKLLNAQPELEAGGAHRTKERKQ